MRLYPKPDSQPNTPQHKNPITVICPCVSHPDYSHRVCTALLHPERDPCRGCHDVHVVDEVRARGVGVVPVGGTVAGGGGVVPGHRGRQTVSGRWLAAGGDLLITAADRLSTVGTLP